MDEQRLSPRKPLVARGILQLGASSFPIKTFDIGSGGIGVVCETAVAVGAQGRVAVTFYWDGAARSITGTCKVAHCLYGNGGFKVGLSFLVLNPESIPVLARYLRPS